MKCRKLEKEEHAAMIRKKSEDELLHAVGKLV